MNWQTDQEQIRQDCQRNGFVVIRGFYYPREMSGIEDNLGR